MHDPTHRPPRGWSRRRWLGGAAVAAPIAAWLARPGDRGHAPLPYFMGLAQALQQAGIAQPTLVLDRRRLQHNLSAIAAHRASGLPLRAVLKSLPSLPLMDQALRAWGSDRVMAFNQAQLEQWLLARPRTRVLLGKPLPVAAAAAALARLPAEAAAAVEWLVDTPQRLAQYQRLAAQHPAYTAAAPMQINLEIDVGLHRGGFEPGQDDALAAALQALQAPAASARWSGFMGYDAHVAALPDLPGMRAHARTEATRRYRWAWELALAAGQASGAAAPARESLTLNTAGSLTFRDHDGHGLPNEVALGSAALLPSDFERPQLADLQAAAFIATPVLKVWPEFRLPEGAGWLSQLARAWDPNQAQALAIHGGHWLADPVSPPGVMASGLFGHSSNQQVMVASARAAQALSADSWVFLRPRQSEALLLQFGDLAVYDEGAGRIDAMWPVLPASA